ncbi:lecithin retinol acyltransferase family protein [Synechocystis sp. LKSZ1]|uniref:lecithin retinol acyltransferase family protein n=1 Tax=Synechocystis sp. LKSZ1 TaxID=3144951 RepID=UPI00336BC389
MGLGDQIYVLREWLTLDGLYEHHGIDCGDGSVIHYRKPSERIERTSWQTFSRGQPVQRLAEGQRFCFLPEIVVERAQSRLGEQKYNLLFNNCEHFATWCKTGISESQQIRRFLPLIDNLPLEGLKDPLTQALQGTDPRNAQRLLNEALGDIRLSWNELQPQYQQAQAEVQAWQAVAQQALQQQREDLARAALHKKRDYQQREAQLKTQLNQLATLTETILRDMLKTQADQGL